MQEIASHNENKSIHICKEMLDTGHNSLCYSVIASENHSSVYKAPFHELFG